MGIRSSLRGIAGPTLKQHDAVWRMVKATDATIERVRHRVALALPVVIRPEPRQLHIAVTAYCNQRCTGCRYGRDFMSGEQLPWPVVRDLLDDGKAMGAWRARFYGGEPLLHPDLPKMVAHAASLGYEQYVTTNAVRLERHIDALFDAGLRMITIGFYGVGDAYDEYVGRRGQFARVEAGIAYARARYGDTLAIRINWLLMRPTCSVEAFEAMLAFAERYDLSVQLDLVHYSLPYFTEGPDACLRLRPEDEPALRHVHAALLAEKLRTPRRFTQSTVGLRSAPDWLLSGADMRVPCDSHQMLWIGPDGTVQQCYVTFELGNLHRNRLRDIVFTDAHRKAARDSFQLNCPNCHCGYDTRVEKHAPAAARYA